MSMSVLLILNMRPAGESIYVVWFVVLALASNLMRTSVPDPKISLPFGNCQKDQDARTEINKDSDPDRSDNNK